jgi:Rrf2 family protein
MLSSSRFVVAIHALSVLARAQDKGPVCSTTIAESVHTNPVVIRRLMAELEKAKLVRSVAGRCGGFALDRNAGGITLADIYHAVEDESMFRMHKTDPNSACPVAKQMKAILSEPLKTAEAALSHALARTSLEDVALAVA